jgi:hypothetical protein
MNHLVNLAVQAMSDGVGKGGSSSYAYRSRPDLGHRDWVRDIEKPTTHPVRERTFLNVRFFLCEFALDGSTFAHRQSVRVMTTRAPGNTLSRLLRLFSSGAAIARPSGVPHRAVGWCQAAKRHPSINRGARAAHAVRLASHRRSSDERRRHPNPRNYQYPCKA